MMAFQGLDLGCWEKFEDLVMHTEMIYPEPIRTPREEFVTLLHEDNSIAKMAILDGKYIGNAVGFCLNPMEFKGLGLSIVDPNQRFIYLFNIAIEPEYQGRGYGYNLLMDFIKSAIEKGYTHLAGHFRQNSSLHLIKKFGAEEKGVYKNWENTGEDYVLCVLDLSKAATHEPAASGQAPGNGMTVQNLMQPDNPVPQ